MEQKEPFHKDSELEVKQVSKEYGFKALHYFKIPSCQEQYTGKTLYSCVK